MMSLSKASRRELLSLSMLDSKSIRLVWLDAEKRGENKKELRGDGKR